MHPHRIKILDRTDDDHIILMVAHHLELILFPAGDRFLDDNFIDHAAFDSQRGDAFQLFHILGVTAAGAAQRKTRSDNQRKTDLFGRGHRFIQRVGGITARDG